MRTLLTRSLGWTILVAGALGASAAFTRAAHNGLLSAATEIPGTKGRTGSYFWASDQEIVVLRGSSTAGYRPERIHVQTGNVRYLPSIPPALTQGELRGSWRLASDGRRVLWGQQNGAAYQWNIGDIETGGYFSQPSLPFDPYRRPTADWLPGSDGYVELLSIAGGYLAVINGYDGPARNRRRALSVISDPAQIAAVTPRGEIIATIRQPRHYWHGELTRIDIKGGRVEKLNAPVPPRMGSMGVAVAPDGERMALSLWNREPSSGFRLLGPLLSELGVRDQRSGFLRVADFEGNGAVDLGTLSWVTEPGRWRRQGPSQLRWAPDGDRISFFYRDRIYAISVPAPAAAL